ncbi:MAG: class I SAM-dependent methyltransferase [Pseudomonadota bacterium]
MNYDEDAPFEVTRYREMQKALPGYDALYRLTRARLETALMPRSHVLVVGAGGGREVEALSQSDHQFQITGVDPSQDMLSIAEWYASRAKMGSQVKLVQGTAEDTVAPKDGFAAATSLLVMHFLPDEENENGKAAYLQSIRSRLRSGATLVHADVSYTDEFAMFAPVFSQHAELAGLDPDAARVGPQTIQTMPIISPERTKVLLKATGFASIRPFFQTLWYRGWFATAA